MFLIIIFQFPLNTSVFRFFLFHAEQLSVRKQLILVLKQVGLQHQPHNAARGDGNGKRQKARENLEPSLFTWSASLAHRRKDQGSVGPLQLRRHLRTVDGPANAPDHSRNGVQLVDAAGVV